MARCVWGAGTGQARDKQLELHQIAKQGSLEELKAALESGADVNVPGHSQETPLMAAIAARDLGKVELLVGHGADLELTDRFNVTALSRAVDCDFVDAARLLLSRGAERGYAPKYPLKTIDYDIDWPEAEMPEGMKGLMSEEQWKKSVEELRETMGQHPKVEPMIAEVESVEMLRVFLEAGDDLSRARSEVKRAYMGIECVKRLRSTLDEYRRHKSPRYGSSNPERMDYPFWIDMIQLGRDAYAARLHFDDTDPFTKPGVVWCYDRFGASVTELDDGRFVQIGGEHEDSYDPDFHIYNDVVVHDGHGGIQIYGYPSDVFPPTDFHTATRVGRQIYVIGCLGYAKQREPGRTPVYRLELDSWKMEAVVTSGEGPSWLHQHRSKYDAERDAIDVEGGDVLVMEDDGTESTLANADRFRLDLSTFCWQRLA